MTEGLIWHSTPRATVGLVVSGGIVIDAPPYARKWALNRSAAELLNDPRANTAWIPDRRTMTDVVNSEPEANADEDQGWTPPPVAYPVKPDNPHEAPLSVNFSVDRGPQVTVRARTAVEWKDLLEEVMVSGVLAVVGEAYAALKSQAAVGAGLGTTTPEDCAPAPVQAPQGPPPGTGPAYNPQMPPPGVPGQAPAAWQNAGAPQFQPPQFQPQQQWGGQQNGGGNKPQPKQCPPGWYKTDKNGGPGADAWKAWREANQQALKGKISWGGGSTFWVAPDVAGMVHGAGFLVVPA